MVLRVEVVVRCGVNVIVWLRLFCGLWLMSFIGVYGCGVMMVVCMKSVGLCCWFMQVDGGAEMLLVCFVTSLRVIMVGWLSGVVDGGRQGVWVGESCV